MKPVFRQIKLGILIAAWMIQSVPAGAEPAPPAPSEVTASAQTAVTTLDELLREAEKNNPQSSPPLSGASYVGNAVNTNATTTAHSVLTAGNGTTTLVFSGNADNSIPDILGLEVQMTASSSGEAPGVTAAQIDWTYEFSHDKQYWWGEDRVISDTSVTGNIFAHSSTTPTHSWRFNTVADASTTNRKIVSFRPLAQYTRVTFVAPYDVVQTEASTTDIGLWAQINTFKELSH